MIKKVFFICTISFLMISCGSSKNISSTYQKRGSEVTPKKVEIKSTKTNEILTKKEEVTVADKIVWTAVTYKGVPYRFGGMTKRGMDCSGLIFTSFKQRNVPIARTSHQMYVQGENISLREVQRGDLLFFKTSRKRGRVNHVGLVTSVDNGDIRFIHSTTSQGVIVTSLYENYWKRAFIKAKRVL
ncbi:C40 family peptidase [Tenacibaculum singaporense]|uniref:NlpC/P60 family protein n=1 Tax=Tenacibaculum singaporense TaxID=2358479 RepID=A0A3Q8RR62_9FLAO|nr:C40 family peptidase [Tenacibaculum singaporense]AZJ34993.1 NlpC/P60 family protein [Tenacibaculum singaporense]